MKVQIKAGKFHPEDAKIIIDGELVEKVTNVKVDISASSVPTIELKLIPDEIEIDGEFVMKEGK